MKDFEAKLSEYAHLLVEVGLNVQPGQTPSIESNIEYAALTRLCVAACFDCGAGNFLSCPRIYGNYTISNRKTQFHLIFFLGGCIIALI